MVDHRDSRVKFERAIKRVFANEGDFLRTILPMLVMRRSMVSQGALQSRFLEASVAGGFSIR
jgi:hypothetical protein